MRLTCLSLLLLTSLLASCAHFGDHDSSVAAPTGHQQGHSRSLYLYSRARLASLDGDFTSATQMLAEAIAADPNSSFLHSAMGEAKLKTGQVQEALEYINRAIKLDPTQRDPYVLAGVLMSTSGRDRQAVDYLKKAVSLNPKKEDAYLHLAVSLTRLFEYEEAVNTLKGLIKLNSDSVLGYYYLGRTYSQMKLYRDAAGYFKKSIELRPEFDQAAIDMAASHEALGDYSKAIEIYQSILEHGDVRPAVLQRLIQLLIQQRRYEDALEQLNRAAETGLGGQETMRKIGLIHLELEQYDEAVKVFSGILAKEPNAHAARLYLGMAFEEKGLLDRAYEEFGRVPQGSAPYAEAASHMVFILKEKGQVDAAFKFIKVAIAADPGQLEYYLSLSTLHEGQGQNDLALKVLQDVENRFLKEYKLHFRLAVIFDKLGQKQAAIDRMKIVLSINPKDPQALNFLGYSYAELGINLDEALLYIKQALELRPGDGFFLDSLGWVYFKMKKYDLALRYLEEAARIVEDDSTIIEHLGDVHLARREYKKALKMYRKSSEIEPTRKELHEKIRKLRQEHGER
ncbi:MAG TPA: tetratricopeptide repeat protein [Deltaproteobacteria bacterium]|nr:tetratricopeptide repeat protein [Deltaproteobacteria bacterium]